MREVYAYLAGIVDADGTIGVRRSTYNMRRFGESNSPHFFERVVVRQVASAAVDMLRGLFGGHLYLMRPVANGKPLWSWSVNCLRANECLRAIRPWLRIKAAQADNAFALRALIERSKKERVAFGRGHVGASHRSPELTEAMERCYSEGKRLNLVGTGGGGRDGGALLAVR